MDYTLQETHKKFNIVHKGELFEVLAIVNIGERNEPHFILKRLDGRIFSLNMITEYVDGLTEITHWKKVV